MQYVADKVIIYGKRRVGRGMNPRALVERCQRGHTKLTKERVDFSASEVAFHSHVLTKGGVKPNPGKTKVIYDMPTRE